MQHPRITRFRQAAALSTWMIFIVTMLPILAHGLVTGTFVLPFTLTKAELAWLLAALPFIHLACTWALHGLTTGDWSPPALDAIVQLFQGEPQPTGDPGVPIPLPPGPTDNPAALLSRRVCFHAAKPATDIPPPRPSMV